MKKWLLLLSIILLMLSCHNDNEKHRKMYFSLFVFSKLDNCNYFWIFGMDTCQKYKDFYKYLPIFGWAHWNYFCKPN